MTIVRKDWSKQEVAKWFDADVAPHNARVQYSSNGGVTWLPFQLTGRDLNDVTRIITLLQRDNLVRDIKQEKIKVTNEQAQVLNPTSTFMNSVAKAQATSTTGTRSSKDSVHIYRTPNRDYWFSQLPLEEFRKAQPSAVDVSLVTRTTFYDGITANTNEVTNVKLHEGQATVVPRQLGYVFRLMPAEKDNRIIHWWPVLSASNPNNPDLNDPTKWLSVRCARHYDTSLDDIFQNIGPILSVVGGKWVWGWNKRFKFGDTWIVSANQRDTIVNRIKAAGMAVEPTSVTTENDPANYAVEVTPEYIMGVRQQLEQLLQVGDKPAIIEALFKIIAYRNHCVDELKELNKTIEHAREVVSNG